MGGVYAGGWKYMYILPVIRPPSIFACLACRLGGRIGGTLLYMYLCQWPAEASSTKLSLIYTECGSQASQSQLYRIVFISPVLLSTNHSWYAAVDVMQ